MGAMRRTVVGILAALFLRACTACTVTQKDPDYVPPPPLPVLEQLKKAPVADSAPFSAGEDVLSFVTAVPHVGARRTRQPAV